VQKELDAIIQRFKAEGDRRPYHQQHPRRIYSKKLMLRCWRYELECMERPHREPWTFLGSRYGLHRLRTESWPWPAGYACGSLPPHRSEGLTKGRAVAVMPGSASPPMRAEAPEFSPGLSHAAGPMFAEEFPHEWAFELPAAMADPEEAARAAYAGTLWPRILRGRDRSALENLNVTYDPSDDELASTAASQSLTPQSVPQSPQQASPALSIHDVVEAQVKDLEVRRQIEFYFSVQNLCHDFHMRAQMDEEGWVSLQTIMDFPRMQHFYGVTAKAAAATLIGSRIVEVSWDSPPRIRVRDAHYRAAFPRVEMDVAHKTTEALLSALPGQAKRPHDASVGHEAEALKQEQSAAAKKRSRRRKPRPLDIAEGDAKEEEEEEAGTSAWTEAPLLDTHAFGVLQAAAAEDPREQAKPGPFIRQSRGQWTRWLGSRLEAREAGAGPSERQIAFRHKPSVGSWLVPTPARSAPKV